MCGRFVVYSAGDQLRDLLGVPEVPALAPNYNVAITDPSPVVRLDGAGVRSLELMRWGLIPWWSKDEKQGHRCFNARAETAHEKRAFAEAFRRRRCLVVADGFYEWRKDGPKNKQPFYFSLAAGGPFAFAGLWERWRRPGPGGAPSEDLVHSFTILTTTPNALVEPIHDRMAVILDPRDHERWLDPSISEPAALASLFAPFPAAAMRVHAVGGAVNSVRADGPELIAPLSPRQGALFS